MDMAVDAPWPLMTVAIAPKITGDQPRLDAALAALIPSPERLIDTESGRTVLAGMDEADLDLAIAQLRHDHRLDIHVGAPQVAFRETLTRSADIDYTHKRQVGGAFRFARVRLRAAPAERGAGLSFDATHVGDALAPDWVHAVEAGVRSAARVGIVAGFPVVDVRVDLLDAAFHEADSSAIAFEAAAAEAFRAALGRGGAALLEPIMAVRVAAPGDRLDAVVDDLRSRRGVIRSRGPADVDAFVPLANLLGYRATLRSISEGRGEYSIGYARYDLAPAPDGDGPPPAAAAALRA